MNRVDSLLNHLIRGVTALSKACGVARRGLSGRRLCRGVHTWSWSATLFGQATIWQTEFVTFAIVAATLMGSPYVLLTRGHVTVDLLPHYLPDRARRRLALAASVCAWAACAVLAWTGSQYFHEAWTFGWTTESVWGPPLWIPLLTLPLGLGILTLQYSVDILCLATGRARPRGEDPEGEPVV